MCMKRLGVIIPSSNTTVETEFSATLHGSEVSLHYTRIPLKEVTVKALEDMEQQIVSAAELLRDAGVDLVVFACTSGSLVKGLGYDLLIAQEISKAAGCPAVTTSNAVVDTLKTLKAKKIALATPYIKQVTDKEIDFLTKNGFEVVSNQSLGIKENLKIGKLTLQDAHDIAERANSKLADAVFVSCTNFRTFEALPSLERKLAKLVVSSNSATLWAALKALQVKVAVPLGKLFEA